MSLLNNIAIIGLGYVGLPLALRFAEVGLKVIGLDIDITKVNQINDGISYLHTVEHKRIKKVVNENTFSATSDFSNIKKANAIIICVPTPLNKQREPELKFIKETMESILPYLKPYQLLSLESTTYPGTTEEVIVPLIQQKGFKVGEDFFVVYSPEREDPGNSNYSTGTIPKVIGGATDNCLEKGLEIYSKAIEEMVPVSSAATAELTKLLENIYRSVNIGLVNELKLVADKLGINIYEVINAAATKPFGYVPFYPGPGLGGHCIPIDPFYLTWKAREYDVQTKFIELAGEVNTAMPKFVVQKTFEALNDYSKSIKGSKILILGLAYKKNVDDTRESPAVKIIDLLLDKGAYVDYSDPFVTEFPPMRNYQFDMVSIKVNKENLNLYDCVILVTDHDCFDYDLILRNSQILIDTRGKFKQGGANVILA